MAAWLCGRAFCSGVRSCDWVGGCGACGPQSSHAVLDAARSSCAETAGLDILLYATARRGARGQAAVLAAEFDHMVAIERAGRVRACGASRSPQRGRAV